MLNEIRIGNYFVHNSEWNYAQINGVFKWAQIDWASLSECTLFIENVIKIPLTEDWLLKLGFTINSTPSAYGFDCNKVFSGGVLRGAWSRETKAFYCLNVLINGYHKKIEHVHDLQNFFYSHTDKEELTITLSS